MTAFEILPLHAWPMEAVLAVQAKAHASHLIERGEVLQCKIQSASPNRPLSFGAARPDNPDALCGYAIACPWQRTLAPRWDEGRCSLSMHLADCVYVHDIAVDPSCQKQGLAGQLMLQVLQQGRAYGWQQAVLVAVQGAHHYWSRYDFMAASGAEMPDLASFGEDAVWMQRAL